MIEKNYISIETKYKFFLILKYILFFTIPINKEMN